MDKKLVIICLFGWILLPILVSCKSSNIKFVSRNPKVTESSGIVNGERIYFTGTSHIRSYIRYSGGPDFGGMMMGSLLTCASCHGPMGLGGEHNMPMQVMHAPNITYQGLQEEMEEHQDGEGQEGEAYYEYTIEEFRMAVVEGLYPDGQPLSDEMPRFQMAENDLQDLFDFLKSLSE